MAEGGEIAGGAGGCYPSDARALAKPAARAGEGTSSGMSLRGKTFLILCLTTLAAAFLAAGIWYAYTIGRFSAMEAAEAEGAYRRVLSLIAEDVDILDTVVKDWAYWDASYQYAASADPAYEAENLGGANGFDNLRLSCFAFVGRDGRTLYSYAIRPSEAAEVAALARSLAPLGPVTGLALVGHGIHLVAARPARRSDGSGEPRGLVLMARELDAARLARYGRLLGISARLSAQVGGGEPDAEGEGAGAIELVRAPDGLRASAALRDLRGSELIRLEVDGLDDESYGRGAALGLFLVTVLLVGGGVSAASLLVMESKVFLRIGQLAAGLGSIAAGKDTGARLPEQGNDEFSELSRAMNRTLDSLGTVIRQRDATLREVNHRVKNNLQVVASLLSLQAAESRSPEAAEALREGKRRVLALALVHEELYADPDLGSVAATGFLERLALGVEPRTASGAHVGVLVEGSEVAIDAWRAMNVGIIMSEAITAAGKLALDDRGSRRLLLRARAAEDGGFAIELRREGPGPDGNLEGLGSSFARGLAAQIGASIEASRPGSDGLLFALRVPAPPRG